MDKPESCPICGNNCITISKTTIRCRTCGVAVHAEKGFDINGFHVDRWNTLSKMRRKMLWLEDTIADGHFDGFRGTRKDVDAEAEKFCR